MDSRELYSAAEHLTIKLTREREWIHFGTGNEIKAELIEELIMDFFKGNKVNFVFEFNNARKI